MGSAGEPTITGVRGGVQGSITAPPTQTPGLHDAYRQVLRRAEWVVLEELKEHTGPELFSTKFYWSCRPGQTDLTR